MTTTKVNYPNVKTLTPNDLKWEIWMLEERIHQQQRCGMKPTKRLVVDRIKLQQRLKKITN